jgi:hypothetical protein
VGASSAHWRSAGCARGRSTCRRANTRRPAPPPSRPIPCPEKGRATRETEARRATKAPAAVNERTTTLPKRHLAGKCRAGAMMAAVIEGLRSTWPNMRKGRLPPPSRMSGLRLSNVIIVWRADDPTLTAEFTRSQKDELIGRRCRLGSVKGAERRRAGTNHDLLRYMYKELRPGCRTNGEAHRKVAKRHDVSEHTVRRAVAAK